MESVPEHISSDPGPDGSAESVMARFRWGSRLWAR